MKLKPTLLAVALASTFGFATIANAAIVTNNFDAIITLDNSCDVSTASVSDLDFGSHTFADTNIDTTTDITVKCTTDAAYGIGLTGTGNMTGGTHNVAYAMYSDTGRTTTWGDTAGTNTVAATGNGSAQTHTVYGRVASIPSTAVAGAYKDTVTVTVTY